MLSKTNFFMFFIKILIFGFILNFNITFSCFIRLSKAFVFRDLELPTINILYDLSSIFGHCFITLMHLIFYFLCVISLFHMHVSVKSIDCILLSSVALNSILSILSVNTLSVPLLNRYGDFNINRFSLLNFL